MGNPQKYFTGGVQGAWYDISDISTLFQDSTFTTPVTADGQSVGGVKDKSGNNYHLKQATAGSRPVYRANVGGTPYLEVGNTQFMVSDMTFPYYYAASSLYVGVRAESLNLSTAALFGIVLDVTNRTSIFANNNVQRWLSTYQFGGNSLTWNKSSVTGAPHYGDMMLFSDGNLGPTNSSLDIQVDGVTGTFLSSINPLSANNNYSIFLNTSNGTSAFGTGYSFFGGIIIVRPMNQTVSQSERDDIRAWFSSYPRISTVTANTGIYSLMGTNTLLTVARKPLDAFTGVYSIVGTPASLRNTKVVFPADSGTYQLVGPPTTNLSKNMINMVVNSGTYAITGTAILREYRRAIVANIGNYSIVGPNTPLPIQRALPYRLSSGDTGKPYRETN